MRLRLHTDYTVLMDFSCSHMHTHTHAKTLIEYALAQISHRVVMLFFRCFGIYKATFSMFILYT